MRGVIFGCLMGNCRGRISHQLVITWRMYMEQYQSVGVVTAFVRQLRQSGIFLLTVLMAVGALLYFIIGMFALLGN